jgi:hypothetical protein
LSVIVETIFKVGQALFGLRNELAKAREARKQKVADFLTLVGKSIEEASVLLKRGIYPGGVCQQILSHSNHMEAAIGDLVGQSEAQSFAAQLREVHEIEQLHGELASLSETDRGRKLANLDKAAGFFRATADFVRVSP